MTSVKNWIDDKTKDGDIDYFEYDKFSNVVEIGRGGFGKVSKADLPSMGLEVALKSSIYENSEIEENYINNLNELVKELKLLYKVRHPNINRFLGITKDYKKNYAIVLEYANEKDLRSYLKNKFTSLEWKDKIQMAWDITCGLNYLHSKDIIHRDLHSKNILVNRGRLLIADLGLSKQLTEVTTNSMANGIGMHGYMEPQCFKNSKYKRDKKSDIYSLGVLLWEISSGRHPFSDTDPVLISVQIRNEEREAPVENTPWEYQQLYQMCWDQVPSLRPDINKVHVALSKLKSQFDESQTTQTTQESSSSSSYSSSLKMNFQNQAQEWFNMEYSQKINSIKELKIPNKCYDSSLKIDGFTKLETIDMKNLKLIILEISNCSRLTKISLSELTLSEPISNLKISRCSELNEVKFSKCRIKSLAVSECPKLTKLNCSSIELTELVINDCLSFNELDCSNNEIKYLNLNLCPKITTLNCSDNEQIILEISNGSNLDVLNCHNNWLARLDISNCLKLKESEKITKTSNPNLIISTLRNLATKWLDKYYSQEGNQDFDNSLKIDGFTKLENIDLKNLKLTSLEISNCSQLAKISLSELSSNLEISHCSELNEVKLSKCQVKSLSVSECPKLTKLDCPRSELTELDISSSLTELDCSHNKIKNLNLDLCPKITTLNCSDNELNILEISNCSELEVLNCHNNKLTSLDISNCPKLWNDLEKIIKTSNPNLIISKEEVAASGKVNNKAQKWFNKNYSQKDKKKSITELKISDKDFDSPLKIDGFTELKTIDLKKLKLTSLEISNCSQLAKIYLSELILSSTLSEFTSNLEISRCSELNEVKFSICRIKSLSVSECPKLTKLDCPSCELTELDISNLIELDCSRNKIKYLNLNLCPKITTLNCSYNELNTLEISNCSELEVLNYHNNQLTSLDISHCHKFTETFSNPKINIISEEVKARNLLIVGRTGGGKSTLSNVLSNTTDFKESDQSTSITKNFQKKVFEDKGTKYRVVDTIGVGDTNLDKKKVLYKIAEGIYSMPEGISQVLFVVDGRFTVEEIQTFNIFEKAIFQSGILGYITIVRTKFSNFKNVKMCNEDKEQLLKENETIAEIVGKCNDIFYVDNPPINLIINDDEDQQTVDNNKNIRKKARELLLKYLETVQEKKVKERKDEYFKLKDWDKLRDEISNFMGDNSEEAIEKVADITERRLKSEIPVLIKTFNKIKGGCSIV